MSIPIITNYMKREGSGSGRGATRMRKMLATQGNPSRFMKTFLMESSFLFTTSATELDVTTPKGSKITPSDERKGRTLRIENVKKWRIK